jgi:choline-sulfatase
LTNDPWECANLAGKSAYADIVDGFAKEIEKRWDSDVLRQKIIDSQKSCFALNAAMQAGASEHWDYNRPSEAAHKYVRNHMDWAVVADRFRFPPVR